MFQESAGKENSLKSKSELPNAHEYQKRKHLKELKDELYIITEKVNKDIFKLSTSAASGEFCEWVEVGIDAYIPHHKYQVKPHSFTWFSAVCHDFH